MMDVAAKIKELTQSVLTDPAHFVVDVLFFAKQRPSRLMVILDGDNGITIDTCAEVSRKLSALLDEGNLIDSAYMLEVSTPGLDHPLKLKRQYFKNQGRQFKVHLKDKTIQQGKLVAIDDDKFTLEQVVSKKETKQTEVNFDQIEKAFVMVSFKQN